MSSALTHCYEDKTILMAIHFLQNIARVWWWFYHIWMIEAERKRKTLQKNIFSSKSTNVFTYAGQCALLTLVCQLFENYTTRIHGCKADVELCTFRYLSHHFWYLQSYDFLISFRVFSFKTTFFTFYCIKFLDCILFWNS